MTFRDHEKEFVALRKRIEERIYTTIGELEVTAYKTKEPVPYDKRTSGEHITPKIGETWGELFDCAWFNFKGAVPQIGAGKKVSLLIDFSGEGLVFDDGGNPVKGLTSVTTTDEFPLGLWGKKTVEASECAVGGELIDLWIDAGCNDLQGQYRNDGKLKEAAIVTVDAEARALFYDFTVCLSLYVGLCENDDDYAAEVLPVMLECKEILREINSGTISAARQCLQKLLSAKNQIVDCWYTSIGHSHLDLIFLWPLRETIRKAARTYSTALYLIERHPDYKFGLSQPPLYQWMKYHYPTIYSGIKQKISERRWECQGAFYVECDTNLPWGESLVRQLLYGKKFFRQEFGLDMKVGFLPDVFGYSAALPQLLQKSGTPYFMTQKLSMNDTNRFPRHTFIWKGIDGSEVLTHMLPEDSYNSAAVPQMALYGKHHNKDIDKCPEMLQLFGIGDGGGGPGYEHMERLSRQRNLKGTPPLVQGFSVDFFDRIAKNKDTYRKWQGELYFERHQGTYTSMARCKQYNKQCETALRNCEMLSTIAEVYGNYSYPTERLEEIWKEVLLYQFHDCLPGSSIKRAYDEVFARYDILLNELAQLTTTAIAALPRKSNNGFSIFNPTSWNRSEVVHRNGKAYQAKVSKISICAVATEPLIETAQTPSSTCLENALIKLTFNDDGTIASLYDKQLHREWLRSNGNALNLYPDELTHWDINKDYLTSTPEQAKLKSATPYSDYDRQGIAFTYTIGSSRISQNIYITHDKAVYFDTTVEWNESYRMLRTSFPTSVVADHARCEIQFGHVTRPTHQNTTWDEAKFEVCAHKWADIADNGSGIAMLTNGKYGYKLWDNTIDLNLLRSQSCPCEDGDLGKHSFTYAIYPHSGDAVTGGVIQKAYELNYPLIQIDGEVEVPPLIEIDSPNIVVESIKKAEDSNGYIIRLYESGGSHTHAAISLRKLTATHEVNLIEEPQCKIGSSTFTIDFTPFEITSIHCTKNE